MTTDIKAAAAESQAYAAKAAAAQQQAAELNAKAEAARARAWQAGQDRRTAWSEQVVATYRADSDAARAAMVAAQRAFQRAVREGDSYAEVRAAWLAWSAAIDALRMTYSALTNARAHLRREPPAESSPHETVESFSAAVDRVLNQEARSRRLEREDAFSEHIIGLESGEVTP